MPEVGLGPETGAALPEACDGASEVVGGGGTWADAEKCPESGVEGVGGPLRGGMFGQGCAPPVAGSWIGRGTCGWGVCWWYIGGVGGGVTTRSIGR
ncbi:hypothetical protein [Actinoplanes sp. ATCC 53533]|uniref:hypothetical protein n=1 Tax=Actinoplanes sp. ATCC 53533 TaxID=1288362 RepID=UPI000F77E599|nr:hypothetical protein [Actinoplanes sp. ATCC 53533]